MRREEEEALGISSSILALNVGGEGATSSQLGTGELFASRSHSFFFFQNLILTSPHFPSRYPDPSSVDREDMDTIIGEVAKVAAAEADEIAAEEAAKDVAEDAAEGPTGEAGEASKAAAEEEVVDDKPSSSAASGLGKYLKVGDDLFVHLPWTASTRAPAEGEVFNDEVLAAAGLEVVNGPSIGGGGSQEEWLLQGMSASFEKLQTLHHARLDKANSKMAVVDKAEADLEGRVAKAQDWFRRAYEELKTAQDQLAERKLELVMNQADVKKDQEAASQQAAEERPLGVSTRSS